MVERGRQALATWDHGKDSVTVPPSTGSQVEYYDKTYRPYLPVKNNFKNTYDLGFNSQHQRGHQRRKRANHVLQLAGSPVQPGARCLTTTSGGCPC